MLDGTLELTHLFRCRNELGDELLQLPAVLRHCSINTTERFPEPLDERTSNRCGRKFTERLFENAAVLANVLQERLECQQRCDLLETVGRHKRVLDRLE